ncbi:MAG TPA: glycine cleavage system protein GcvH [Actinomycetes bacterium]
MSDTPGQLKYTAEHEWVTAPDSEGSVRFGITDFAQEALGDIVYVSLPGEGLELVAGQTCGEVESTKSVSDVYAPVSGVVVARNPALDTNPELVNSDPYGEGWMVEVRPSDPAAVDALLDAAGYTALTQAS